MKKIKFKLSSATICILIAVAVLSVVAIVINGVSIYKLSVAVIKNPYKIALCVLVVLIALFAVIISTCILFNSYYKIDGENLNINFGLFKNKIGVFTITEIYYFKKQNKLVMYFGEKFSVVVIDEKDYNSFVTAMREVNPKIVYENKTSNGEIN